MSRSLLFRTLLTAVVLACSVALAQPTPQPRATLACSPPTRFVCVNKQCQCSQITCAACGVQSFSCDSSTGQSTCVCKTC